MMRLFGDYYKGKTVLVTGHTGFVGYWLCRVLIHAGAKVVGYSLDEPGKAATTELISIVGDIRDKEYLRKAFDEYTPEIVFHLAAQTQKNQARFAPLYTYETNILGTLNVLESVRNTSGVKSVVVASSSNIYQEEQWTWAYRENDVIKGEEPLSDSIVCSESIVNTYRNTYFNKVNSPAVSIVRFGNAFGGGDYTEGKLLTECIAAARESRVIDVHNSNGIRPYIHVLDVVRGILLLADRHCQEKILIGEYNFCPDYDNCALNGDIAMLFCKEWGENLSSRYKYDNNYENDRLKIRLDNSKSKNLLLWVPNWSLKESIARLVKWEKSVINGVSANEITDRQINEYISEIKTLKNPCL